MAKIFLTLIASSSIIYSCSSGSYNPDPVPTLTSINNISEGEKWGDYNKKELIRKFKEWCESPNNDFKKESAQRLSLVLSDFIFSEGEYNVYAKCSRLAYNDQKKLVDYCNQIMKEDTLWLCINQLINNNTMCDLCWGNKNTIEKANINLSNDNQSFDTSVLMDTDTIISSSDTDVIKNP